ncbi:hypothetical protein R1flu_020551 [Riccia fluitans]|uniref:Uncharacterized protein n=1 Tax=Riccia fluitans TaxID=41844 RepID=A0ABD1ZLU2_9MARC
MTEVLGQRSNRGGVSTYNPRMSGDHVQKVGNEISAIENWEFGEKRPNSNHNGQTTYDTPGIQAGDTDSSKYSGSYGNIAIHNGCKQMNHHSTGEEEIAMARRAPTTKKPKEEEDQGKTIGPDTCHRSHLR